MAMEKVRPTSLATNANIKDRIHNAKRARKDKRNDKRKNERERTRLARKELNQVAPDQFSYPQAREDNTTPAHQETRNEPDWKNIPDNGSGITQFLWQEEIQEWQAEIRENEIKYWAALDRKEWEQTSEKTLEQEEQPMEQNPGPR